MSRAEALRWIGRVRQLNTLPQVALEILRITGDEDYAMDELVACLDRDPALTTKLLRIVNSPQFGLRQKVVSLRMAVSFLGRRSLRLLSTSFSLSSGLSKGVAGQLYESYWRRTLLMVAAAKNLARIRREVDPNEAHVAGLVADIGQLIFAQADPAAYAPLVDAFEHGPELLRAEQAALGCTHPELSACFLESLGFPPALVESALRHHIDQPDDEPLSAEVWAADRVAQAILTPNESGFLPIRKLLDKTYGLDVDGVIDFVLACKNEWADSTQLFDIRSVNSPDYDAILAQARDTQQQTALAAALELDSIEAVFSLHPANK